jgi:spermidine/putrescine-binding protein
MGIKSFLIKKTLQAKGVSKDQAELIANKISDDPAFAEKLKVLQDNKEVKELFEKIQKEMEQLKKEGKPEQYAMMMVMAKHKDQIIKYREELMPLMELMQGMGS